MTTRHYLSFLKAFILLKKKIVRKQQVLKNINKPLKHKTDASNKEISSIIDL